MAIKKISIFISCILLCNVYCNAQERAKIDRRDTGTSTKTSGDIIESNATTRTNTLSVSSKQLSFPASGGSQTVTVTASGTWNIGTETYYWGHLTKNGNTVTVKIDANSSSSARTDYFTINSGDKTVRINISQEKADILRVSSKQLSFPASGGSQTVTVTASGTWNIGTKTYYWGHLTKNGNTVIVEIDANGDTNAREDYFTIRSGDLVEIINISQSGIALTAQDLERIEKEKYESACQKGTINALLEYLRTYPNGKYANSASNMIAIAKARSLNMFSTSSAFNEALGYAKDVSTRSLVLQYINKCKKQQEKEQRRQRAKKNGGYVQFGLEPFDFASNCVSLNREQNVMYYNVGVSVRFGNFRSPVQFELGVKPGMTFSYTTYDYGKYWHYGYEYYNFHVGFHMPVYAKLKVNICDVAYESKFYVVGMGYYNAVRDKELENQFSLGSGAGFAWRHWDLMFYYKQDLNNKHHLDDKYIGSSVVYYF